MLCDKNTNNADFIPVSNCNFFMFSYELFRIGIVQLQLINIVRKLIFVINIMRRVIEINAVDTAIIVVYVVDIKMEYPLIEGRKSVSGIYFVLQQNTHYFMSFKIKNYSSLKSIILLMRRI